MHGSLAGHASCYGLELEKRYMQKKLIALLQRIRILAAKESTLALFKMFLQAKQ